MADKQGETKTVTQKGDPQFKGPGVEGKKAATSILTIRDGVPKRVLFDGEGKEIGAELAAPSWKTKNDEK
jgi:hypothetical protein